ncbi:hypothetical protein E2562_000981 [Oryza meyeriana var. granulata]|uniref:Uncharacterized protein n=1 Tax=Oryza meyeriana var. granulata TaxID=110450 RepID=A0A6G1CXK8_9ORYZ|nr:hypothetical protein E2562_000981 [Oryza meyeriana var. granulata]
MKLFAFVSRRCRRLSAAAPVVAEEPAAMAMAEDAATVVAPAEKRRRRPSGSGSGPGWKPTLGVISEDAAVVSTAAKAKPAATTKAAAAKKGKARPSPRVVRSDYDDFRHFGATTVLPAFAPTAFLF